MAGNSQHWASHLGHRMELRHNSLCVCVPDHCESIKAAGGKVTRWTVVHGNDIIAVWCALELIPNWFWIQSQCLQQSTTSTVSAMEPSSEYLVLKD